MTTETKYTPLPWAIYYSAAGCFSIRSKPEIDSDEFPRNIADVIWHGDNANATLEDVSNAEFIVRACNAHNDLLDALKTVVKWAERHGLDRTPLITGQMVEMPVIAIARDAIAKAEAGKMTTNTETKARERAGAYWDEADMELCLEVTRDDFIECEWRGFLEGESILET